MDLKFIKEAMRSGTPEMKEHAREANRMLTLPPNKVPNDHMDKVLAVVDKLGTAARKAGW